MSVISVRLYEEDIEALNDYCQRKNLKQASAVRELMRLGLKIDSMREKKEDDEQTFEELATKLLKENLQFSIEANYLARTFVSGWCDKMSDIRGSSGNENVKLCIESARTFVEGLLKSDKK